tara:strand:+ start:962 stop:1504 length:543 start_codon:yes stop_codon:yes gene_type:complete
MSRIINIETKFEGVKLLELESFSDNRGFFREVYNQEILKYLDLDIKFIQDNESSSVFGTLRGLHFQNEPYAQSKLIRVSLGKVQDVIVDLREGADTYGQWESYELSSDNSRMLFVPKGFAHGFLVLTESAIVNYKVDCLYNPKSESGILYNDSSIDIEWSLEEEQIIVSKKDLSLPKIKL